MKLLSFLRKGESNRGAISRLLAHVRVSGRCVRKCLGRRSLGLGAVDDGESEDTQTYRRHSSSGTIDLMTTAGGLNQWRTVKGAL